MPSFTFFFLFILLLKISLLKIIIPFKTNDYFYTNDSTKFILNYFIKVLSVDISIGEPKQIITLAACLGEYNTFIISKDCEGYEGIYNQNKSDTYKKLEAKPIDYIFEMFDNGIISEEKFIFNNNEINELKFMNVFHYGDNQCYNAYCEVLTQPGILGFLIEQNRNTEEDLSKINFIKQLKNKRLIPNYNFYFEIFSDNNTGNIIIGEDEKESYFPQLPNKTFSFITVSNMDYGLDWALKFDEIYYGEERLSKDIISQSIFRIEFGFIKGNYEMEKYIDNNFFDDLIKEKICFRKTIDFLNFGSTLYYYYCNKNVDLTKFKPWKFTINEFKENFTFTYEDLFSDIGDKYIFLMIYNVLPNMYLGYPFFKKYKFIFNPDNKTIGYYGNIDPNENTDNSEPKSKTVYIIVISFLSVVLISLAIFAFIIIFIKKKKKKNAKELLDETPYNNNYNNNEGLIPNEESTDSKN